MIFPRILTPLCGAVLLAAASGCSDSGPEGESFVVREIPKAHREFRVVDSSRERFRYRTAAESSAANRESGGPRLVYDVPEGWTEQPGSAMRDINLVFGGEGEGECYVARLPGAGGGLAANVNRWRGQMGAEPLSDEEIAALPTQALFGQPATLVEVDGDFSGMGAASAKKDYRMIGLILASDAGAVFVKMTGPREMIAANREAFDSFVESLDVSMGGS